MTRNGLFTPLTGQVTMTKIYNLQTPQSVIPKQWHRSYPPSSVSGTGWMLDALDDLAAFARDRNLPEIADRVQEARREITPYLEYQDS